MCIFRLSEIKKKFLQKNIPTDTRLTTILCRCMEAESFYCSRNKYHVQCAFRSIFAHPKIFQFILQQNKNFFKITMKYSKEKMKSREPSESKFFLNPLCLWHPTQLAPPLGKALLCCIQMTNIRLLGCLELIHESKCFRVYSHM